MCNRYRMTSKQAEIAPRLSVSKQNLFLSVTARAKPSCQLNYSCTTESACRNLSSTILRIAPFWSLSQMAP